MSAEAEAKEAGICLALFQKAFTPIKTENESKNNKQTEESNHNAKGKENANSFETPKQESKVTTNGCESNKRIYSLRSSSEKALVNRSKRVKYQPSDLAPKWIPTDSKSQSKHSLVIRDKILAQVDIKSYHSFVTDDFAWKIIQLASQGSKSHSERFTVTQRRFIALSWLTTMRIFEYIPIKDQYIEVKRIPSRFIPLSPNLITCFHQTAETFYVAYLWGDQNGDKNLISRPYVEMRNLHGELQDKPFHYKEIVKKIYSDSEFIYVFLCSNELFIHRKNLFNYMYHKVDLTDQGTIFGCWVESASYESSTKLPLVIATSEGLSLCEHTALDHNFIKFLYDCHPNYTILSVNQYKSPYFIIHLKANKRGSNYASKLDIGYLHHNTKVRDWSFNLTAEFEFEYTILHSTVLKQLSTKLFLFGYREKGGVKQFEAGCYNHDSGAPIWVTHLQKLADADSQVLFSKDDLVVITDKQQVKCVLTNKEKFRCRECELDLITQDDMIRHDLGNHDHMFKDLRLSA